MEFTTEALRTRSSHMDRINSDAIHVPNIDDQPRNRGKPFVRMPAADF